MAEPSWQHTSRPDMTPRVGAASTHATSTTHASNGKTSEVLDSATSQHERCGNASVRWRTALGRSRRGAWPLLRRNWLLTILLLLGGLLRGLSMAAYRPALLYIDSFGYLRNVSRLTPNSEDPLGYPLWLKPLLHIDGLFGIALIQHLMGLAVGIACYALPRRIGARRWLCALAAAPVLLDAYQIQIEQNILSDTLFETMIVLGLGLVLLGRGQRRWTTVLAGFMLGLAVLVREVGLVLIVPALVYVLVAARGWRVKRTIAGLLLAGFVVPVAGYVVFFATVMGRVGMTNADGGSLYGRAATIAVCARDHLPADEAMLCPSEPVSRRPGVDFYAHDPGSPIASFSPSGTTPARAEADFAKRVFEAQPLDVAKAIGGDFVKLFAPSRMTDHNDVAISRWQFQNEFPIYPGLNLPELMRALHEHMPSTGTVPAHMLRVYQLDGGYTPGPLLAVFLVVAIAGTVVGGIRCRPGWRVCLLLTLTALLVLLAADAFEFSWRYQLPALILLPPAGAIGAALLSRRLRVTRYQDRASTSSSIGEAEPRGASVGTSALRDTTASSGRTTP